jgi:hypothetical protein
VTQCLGAFSDVSTVRVNFSLINHDVPLRLLDPRDPAKRHKPPTRLTHSTISLDVLSLSPVATNSMQCCTKESTQGQLYLNSTYAVRHVVISRRKNWV